MGLEEGVLGCSFEVRGSLDTTEVLGANPADSLKGNHEGWCSSLIPYQSSAPAQVTAFWNFETHPYEFN